MQARDRLLPGIAALGIRDAPELVVAHLLRDRLVIHFGAERWPARENAGELERVGVGPQRAAGDEPLAHRVGAVGREADLQRERGGVTGPRHIRAGVARHRLHRAAARLLDVVGEQTLEAGDGARPRERDDARLRTGEEGARAQRGHRGRLDAARFEPGDGARVGRHGWPPEINLTHNSRPRDTIHPAAPPGAALPPQFPPPRGPRPAASGTPGCLWRRLAAPPPASWRASVRARRGTWRARRA